MLVSLGLSTPQHFPSCLWVALTHLCVDLTLQLAATHLRWYCYFWFFVVWFVFLLLLICFVGYSLPVSMWSNFVVETSTTRVCSSLTAWSELYNTSPLTVSSRWLSQILSKSVSWLASKIVLCGSFLGFYTKIQRTGLGNLNFKINK